HASDPGPQLRSSARHPGRRTRRRRYWAWQHPRAAQAPVRSAPPPRAQARARRGCAGGVGDSLRYRGGKTGDGPMSRSSAPLRALVVEDEAPARRTLQLLLAAHSDVDLVGECATGPEAVDAIQRIKPDLLFLDVQLPGFGGFEVLERVKNAS